MWMSAAVYRQTHYLFIPIFFCQYQKNTLTKMKLTTCKKLQQHEVTSQMGVQSVYPTIYLPATAKINPYYKLFDPVLIIATVPLMIGKLILDKYYWYSEDRSR